MARMEELLSSEESGRGAGTPWRRLAIAGFLIVLLILAIVLPPLVNLNKYRRQITASMSEALGRPVYVSGMQLRLLPTPGIVMTDLTVEEDPAFGYEPALHASSVVASLRLTSLWRGRLEVSRISLDEANLNLVRNAAGQWSIGSILLRASQIPNAPTAERHAGAHARFPYIEATNARIDFKEGVEKKPFSLMNAEFSMWQSSEDEWQLRLQGQPVRTDLEVHLPRTPLSDAGTLHLDGSLRRAANLLAMPVNLRAQWSGAQLGQVSALLTGVDSGWRGALSATTTIRGIGGDLQLQSRVEIANLRRQEFQPANTVNLNTTCRSEYRHAERRLSNITCFWPVQDGHLLLTGSLQGLSPAGAHLQLEINRIPAAFPLTLLGLMRANAQNVTATGAINGELSWGSAALNPPAKTPAAKKSPEKKPAPAQQPAPGSAILTGDVIASGVSLSYPGGKLALPPLHFIAEPAPPDRTTQKIAAEAPLAAEPAILLEPLPVPMGEPKPLIADARLTPAGFLLHLAGDASLSHLMGVGGNFALLENALALAAPHGRATVDTTTTGAWMPPMPGAGAGIATTGTLHIENLELHPHFLRAPVAVQSAEIDLTPDQVAWNNVDFRYQGTALHGSMTFPASCALPGTCPANFVLQAGTVNAAALEAMLRANRTGLLGEILSLGEGSPGAWPSLAGTVDCDALQLGRLTIQPAKAAIAVEGSKLTIQSLEGSALGGTLTAAGAMTLSGGTPQWKLDVGVKDARMKDVGTLFHEAWGSGTASGEANLTLHGYAATDLASSAAGDFAFTWDKGGLAVGLHNEGLTRFDRWTGKGTVANRTLTLTESEVARGGKTAAVQGTIGFDRTLNLTLTRRAPRAKAAGPLAQPGH